MNLPNDLFLRRIFCLRHFMLVSFMLTSSFALAKTSDQNQPLNIEADSVEIREQQGISIYKGHVNISRGSMLIKGQLIHITRKKNDTFIINVEGTPASFRQLNDSDEEVSAESQKMTFSSATGILTLDKQASLIQGQNQFTSEHIVYNTKQDIVQAGKDETATDTSEPKRVSITIQPKQENNTQHDQPQ